MSEKIESILKNLSQSVDKLVLTDPRLDFPPSSRYYIEIGTLPHLSIATEWPWQIVTPTQRMARVPKTALNALMQVGIGVVRWTDRLSPVATQLSNSVRRCSPLFIADAVIKMKDGNQVICLTSRPVANHLLIAWFKKYGINAHIDPTANIAMAFTTDDPSIQPEILESVHLGAFLSSAGRLARAINPDFNPGLAASPGVSILAGFPIELASQRPLPSNLALGVKMDIEQEQALIAALRGDNFFLIGPPGCGKTRTIAAIISAMSICFPDLKIGVASPVYAALDALRRLGNEIANLNYVEFCLSRDYQPQSLDLLIVDESSQTTTAELFPLGARANQIIIVGDPDQTLPPVATPKMDEEDISLIYRVKTNRNFKAYELHNHYRSKHEDLLFFSNGFVYDGHLRIVPSPTRGENEGFCPHFIPTAAGQSGNHYVHNLEEAKILARDIVAEAIASQEKPVSRMAIGWTYAQARLIEKQIKIELERQKIDISLLSPVEGEPFLTYEANEVQGQERDEVWISFGNGINPKTKKIATAYKLNVDYSIGAISRMNVLTTRARITSHFYHSISPIDIINSKTSIEKLVLAALMSTEIIHSHASYQIDPHPEANAVARRLAYGDKTLPNPEAYNLACVFGVRDRDDPPDCWRYGLFRSRPEWTEDHTKAVRDMLIAKNWILKNF